MKDAKDKEWYSSWICKKCKCFTDEWSTRAPKCPVCQNDMRGMDCSKDWKEWMRWRKGHTFFVYVPKSKMYRRKK